MRVSRTTLANAADGAVSCTSLRYLGLGHEYLATAREDQKFGIALTDVPDMVAKIRSHSQLRFLGLHSHIGSQIFVVDGFIAAAERLLDVHARLLENGEVPELNLGGGFGISYTAAVAPSPGGSLLASPPTSMIIVTCEISKSARINER